MDNGGQNNGGYEPRRYTVVCTGGRDYYDEVQVDLILTLLAAAGAGQPNRQLHIGVGCATGADEVVREWCKENKVSYKKHVAQWKKFGRSAGPKRNVAMLEEEQPRLVVAFPGGDGTANCVNEARKRDIPVLFVGEL